MQEEIVAGLEYCWDRGLIVATGRFRHVSVASSVVAAPRRPGGADDGRDHCRPHVVTLSLSQWPVELLTSCRKAYVCAFSKPKAIVGL